MRRARSKIGHLLYGNDELTTAKELAGIEPLSAAERIAIARRGTLLSRFTIAYNSAEGVIAVVAGVLSGSVALVGFGVDSVIEVVSSVAALWRLRSDADEGRRERAERITLRVVGASFVALAVYVAVDAAHSLWTREAPERSIPGLLITGLSVVIMPLLAKAKRRVGEQLGSRALVADAMQTNLCAYLSVIVLVGLLLNAIAGWWWADPLAALAMVPIIGKEGVEGLRGEDKCNC